MSGFAATTAGMRNVWLTAVQHSSRRIASPTEPEIDLSPAFILRDERAPPVAGITRPTAGGVGVAEECRKQPRRRQRWECCTGRLPGLCDLAGPNQPVCNDPGDYGEGQNGTDNERVSA